LLIDAGKADNNKQKQTNKKTSSETTGTRTAQRTDESTSIIFSLGLTSP
jgi:hypothetical protein